MIRFPVTRGWARLPGVAALLLLGACAGQVQPPAGPADWRQQRAALERLDAWTATGKVAVRAADTSESGSLDWRQRPGLTEVRLSGPVGVGTTTIASDGEVLEINRGGERQVLDIATPGALASATGWDLPLAALPYWLRGLPAPAPVEHTLELDPASRRPLSLAQDGWLVRYSDFQAVEHLLLPTRLEITRGDTRARVVIRQWTLDSAAPERTGDEGALP